MILVSKCEEKISVKCDDQKDAAPFSTLYFQLEHDGESDSVYPVLSDGSGYTANYKPAEQKILDVMQSAGAVKKWKAKELLDATGLPDNTFYTSLKRLANCGAVHKGEKTYRLADDHQHEIMSNDPFDDD